MKYNIGDIVTTYKFKGDWAYYMDQYVGKEGKITAISEGAKKYLINGWWWPESALTQEVNYEIY